MGAATRVGVVGVGAMGSEVVRGLTAAGFEVTGHDRDPGRAEAVTAAGARWADGLEDCIEGVDVLVTVLPNAATTASVVSAALEHMPAGTCWLDLGSGDPRVTADLAASAAERGIASVAAPMGGSVPEARQRTLHFFVGGSTADVERVLPLLAALGEQRGVQHAGASPSDAQVAKLLANALWFAHAAAGTEALLLGQALGLAPDALRQLLSDSAGGSVFMERYMGRLLDGDYLEAFPIDGVVEELRTVGSLAAGTGTPTPVLSASADLHEQSLEHFGPIMGELLGARLLEERAGTILRRPAQPSGQRSPSSVDSPAPI